MVFIWCIGILFVDVAYILGKMLGVIVYIFYLLLFYIEMWEYFIIELYNIEVKVFLWFLKYLFIFEFVYFYVNFNIKLVIFWLCYIYESIGKILLE